VVQSLISGDRSCGWLMTYAYGSFGMTHYDGRLWMMDVHVGGIHFVVDYLSAVLKHLDCGDSLD
jgi:hypothetical protein